MGFLSDINTWFWNEYFWLPSNITWNDISDTSSVNYAQFADLRNGFKVAAVLLIVKYILEKYVFSPIGKYLGLNPKVTRNVCNETTENKLLEKVFCENGRIDYKKVQGLAKQLDWSERKVERWIRRRISRGKTSNLKKFTENAWKFTFRLCATCFGIYVMCDKPYFWTSNYDWTEYPHHSVTDDIWWYFMLELGFFLSLNVSQFVDTKRKDVLPMFVHHIAVVMLLSISWTLNVFRILCAAVVISEVVLVPLHASKMAEIFKHKRLVNASFIVFVVTWIVSRLILYPYRILYSALYEFPLSVSLFPAYYVGTFLLCLLYVINLFWTWIIVKMAFRAVYSKNLEIKDIRSESDEDIHDSTENDTGSKRTFS